MAHDVGQRYTGDEAGLQRHHVAEPVLVYGVYGRHAVAAGQHPVEGGRAATALHVAEHRHTGLVTGSSLELGGHGQADAAQPLVSEPIHLGFGKIHGAGCGPGPFGDHDDRGVPAPLMAFLYDVGHHLDVERVLGHQGDGGPTGHAGPSGDVAHVATHHLDDHDPVMGLGRGVEPVDGLGGYRHRRVEAEGLLGARNVVVDGLGHPDHRYEALGMGTVCDRQRAFAADDDQGIQPELGQGGQGPLHPVVGQPRVDP